LDSWEKNVVIACGLYLLSEEGKLVKRKYWTHNISSKRRRRRIPHSCGRLKDITQFFFSNI